MARNSSPPLASGVIAALPIGIGINNKFHPARRVTDQMATRTVARTCCPGIVMLDKYMRFRSHLEGRRLSADARVFCRSLSLMASFFGVIVTRKGLVRDTHNPEAFAA